MQAALEAYLSTLTAGGTHRDGVLAAAMAERDQPWNVVQHAGLLARCRPAVAPVPTGLTSSLRKVPMGSRASIVRVGAGQRYPVLVQKRRYRSGVHDAPPDLARDIVEQAIAASDGRVHVGMDIACGPGAFLVAMAEAGVGEIYGSDVDPLCLEVAAIACPGARLLQDDPTKHGPPADLVVGTPPFVARQRVDGPRRFDFRHRFPWLGRTVDFAAGFAATAVDRVRPGGGIGLVLPTESMVRPSGSTWRARFVARHQVVELVGPMPFPGTTTDVTMLVAQAGGGPSWLPAYGLHAREALTADNVVLDPQLRPGDIEMMRRIQASSTPLSEVAKVSAGIGLVDPGSDVPANLVTQHPGEGRVPFAEARGFFAGERHYLLYKPSRLHRPTTRSLHERPKVVLQRARARSAIRAEVDRSGVYVGASCTVVTPEHPALSVEMVHALLTSMALEGWLRVKNGRVTDLTPRIIGEIPIPNAWLEGRSAELPTAWGVSDAAVESLAERGTR